MKVGILTFPHSPSLGAMLQMGSLYHTIQEMGHDVEIINYVSSNVNHKKKEPLTIKSLLIRILSKIFLKSSLISYKEFESKLKMFPGQPISESREMEKIVSHFDRIIVGSDQVWNPVVTGHDLNFYLEFCSDTEKKLHMQLVLDICRRIKNILIGYLNYLMTLNFSRLEKGMDSKL